MKPRANKKKMEDTESNGSTDRNDGMKMQEEEEVELGALVTKDQPGMPSTYGGLLDYGVGTDVEGYMAVSRGLDRFVQPKYFAEILFAAADAKMPWISRVVPQGIMVNSAFVVDIKALENESVLYKDGLGTWIQNCGKVSNYFVWDRHEAMEVKGGNHPDAVEFIRRIDKNAGCSAYTRVVVQSNQLGLAVLQYFFKGVVERPFEVVNYRPKKPIPTNFATPQRQFLPASTPNSVASGTRSRKRKERPSAKEEYEENEGSATDEGYPYYTMAPQVTKVVRMTKHQDILDGSSGEVIAFANHTDHSSETLVRYLTNHIDMEQKERAEDRKLKREEMEARRKESQEDRQERKEELEVRKQELKLSQTRLNLEQQKWDIERKEKELFLDLLRRKFLDK